MDLVWVTNQYVYVATSMCCVSAGISPSSYTGLFPIQCELYYWIDVLDRFDVILEEASKDEQDTPTDCIFMCPKLMEPQVLGTCHTYTTVLCRN